MGLVPRMRSPFSPLMRLEEPPARMMADLIATEPT